MRVLIDIAHPAHVHVFRHVIAQLRERGHAILVTSRRKEMALDLLEAMGIQHRPLSALGGHGMLGLMGELCVRDFRLYRVVRQWRPDVMAGIGGIFIAHVGFLTRIPALAFYDTENARLQNLLTYPLARRVIVPRCYGAWTPRARTVRYPGYHELAYLRPPYFSPDRAIAIANGLASDRRNFLVRLVSWQANHDVGERGISTALLQHLIQRLASCGNVIVSAEAALPENLQAYRYRGDYAQIHHVMAHCDGFFGESATMASESCVLGVPAVYAAQTGRGYTDEQELRYGLVRNVRQLNQTSFDQAIDWMLAQDAEVCRGQRSLLLADTCDVARFFVAAIESRGAIDKFEEPR